MNKWIDITDRVPGEFQPVLAARERTCGCDEECRCAGSGSVSMAMLNRDGDWERSADSLMLFGITHWQPIPKPPRAANQTSGDPNAVR